MPSQSWNSLGLIMVTMEGSFAMKVGEVSRARALRLNWIGDYRKTVSPDKLEPLDFSRLTDKQKRRIAKRSAALERYLAEVQTNSSIGETRTLMAYSVRETRTAAVESVRESRTPEAENGGNQQPSPVRVSRTRILHHIPGDLAEVSPSLPGCVQLMPLWTECSVFSDQQGSPCGGNGLSGENVGNI